MAISSIKVRFNLSAGKNYMKWKVEYPDRKPEYYDPKEFQLVLGGCTLKNHKKTAEKIHQGASKTVCAWVLCTTIAIYKAGSINMDGCEQIKYNPRVRPNWMWGDTNVDGCSLPQMVSESNRLFSPPMGNNNWDGSYIIRRFISAKNCMIDF